MRQPVYTYFAYVFAYPKFIHNPFPQATIKADNELNDINRIVNQSFETPTSDRWSFERRLIFHFTFTIELYLSELR